LERAVAAQSQDIRRERRRQRELRLAHEEVTGREVEALETQEVWELAEQRAERENELGMRREEVRLLQLLCERLRLRLQASPTAPDRTAVEEAPLVTAVVATTTAHSASSSSSSSAAAAVEASEMEIALAESQQISRCLAEEEEERCTLRRVCDTLSNGLAALALPRDGPGTHEAALTVGSYSHLHHHPEGACSKRTLQELDEAFLLDKQHNELEVKALKQELADENAEHDAVLSQQSVGLRTEQEAAHAWLQHLRWEEHEAACARSGQLYAVRSRLLRLTRDLAATEREAHATEAEALYLRETRGELAAVELEGRARCRKLAARSTIARASSTEMIRFSDSALTSAEGGSELHGRLAVENAELEEELRAWCGQQGVVLDELAVGEREAAALERQLASVSASTRGLRVEAATLAQRLAEHGGPTAEQVSDLDGQNQAFDIREQLAVVAAIHNPPVFDRGRKGSKVVDNVIPASPVLALSPQLTSSPRRASEDVSRVSERENERPLSVLLPAAKVTVRSPRINPLAARWKMPAAHSMVPRTGPHQ